MNLFSLTKIGLLILIIAGMLVLPIVKKETQAVQTSREIIKLDKSLPPVPQSTPAYLNFTINYVYRAGGKGALTTLANESVLHSGDYYKIIFTPTEDCYVYIFQIDSANQIFQLFPMERFGSVTVNNFNPVQTGQTYYLPAKQKSFVLDQQTGVEKIYFLASRQRDQQLEAQYQRYLEAQQLNGNLAQQLDQIDKLLQAALEAKGLAKVTSDPAETAKNSWQEDGQTFTVLQQRLENMCDGCVQVLRFRHE